MLMGCMHAHGWSVFGFSVSARAQIIARANQQTSTRTEDSPTGTQIALLDGRSRVVATLRGGL